MNSNAHHTHGASRGFTTSQEGKENFSEDSNAFHEMNNQQENELKRRMYENMKKAGILEGLKSNMRGNLYKQLKL